MREPEVRGLQIRWRGTKITAAATVCNFKDRIQKATAASRLTGSLLQYLLVELLWDRSGYVPLHFGEKETRATHNTALTKKKKKPLLSRRGTKPIPLRPVSAENAGRKGFRSTVSRCTMYVKAVHACVRYCARKSLLTAAVKAKVLIASCGCRLVARKNVCKGSTT